LATLLYNTGYITIKDVTPMPDGSYQYAMGYPNYEVRNSFLRNILKHYTGYKQIVTAYLNNLLQALQTDDIAQLIAFFKTLFASITYDLHPTESQVAGGWTYEVCYQNVLYAILKVTGMQVSAEERTNRGRIDLVAESPKSIYIFEMKVDKPAKEAIEQIKQKGYAEKYRLANKKIFLVGLSFSSEERNIADYEVEEA